MMQLHGHRLPMCSSYEGARRVLEKSPEFKDGDGRRGLVNKYERGKSVFMECNDICFQYHQTILVRWVNEHTVIIHHHGSRSSRIFIDRFLPTGVNVYSVEGRTVVNGVEPKGHCTTWRYQPDKARWEVDLGTATSRVDVIVDRKIAALARKKLAPYQDWRKTVEVLKGRPLTLMTRHPSKYCLADLKAILEGPEIPPMDFWDQFNIPDLDVAAATALGAVSTKDIGPYLFPSKSKYQKYVDLIQES